MGAPRQTVESRIRAALPDIRGRRAVLEFTARELVDAGLGGYSTVRAALDKLRRSRRPLVSRVVHKVDGVWRAKTLEREGAGVGRRQDVFQYPAASERGAIATRGRSK